MNTLYLKSFHFILEQGVDFNQFTRALAMQFRHLLLIQSIGYNEALIDLLGNDLHLMVEKATNASSNTSLLESDKLDNQDASRKFLSLLWEVYSYIEWPSPEYAS